MTTVTYLFFMNYENILVKTVSLHLKWLQHLARYIVPMSSATDDKVNKVIRAKFITLPTVSYILLYRL